MNPIKRAFQHCWGPMHYYSRTLEYIGNEIFRERSVAMFQTIKLLPAILQ